MLHPLRRRGGRIVSYPLSIAVRPGVPFANASIAMWAIATRTTGALARCARQLARRDGLSNAGNGVGPSEPVTGIADVVDRRWSFVSRSHMLRRPPAGWVAGAVNRGSDVTGVT